MDNDQIHALLAKYEREPLTTTTARRLAIELRILGVPWEKIHFELHGASASFIRVQDGRVYAGRIGDDAWRFGANGEPL